MTLYNTLADTNNIFYFAHTTTKHKYPKPDAKAKYNYYKYLKKKWQPIYFLGIQIRYLTSSVAMIFQVSETPCRICEKNLLLKIN